MTRILIADDHEVVRTGLRHILERVSRYQVVGEAAAAQEVLPLVRSQPADVLLLDLSMRGRSGLELLPQIVALPNAPRVLVLTMHAEEHYSTRAFQAGAAGYLTKDAATTELVNAVDKIAAGGVYVSQTTAELLAQQLYAKPAAQPHELLSNRELEVFRRICRGQTPTEIAHDLAVSAKTVSTYKTRILEKMRLGSDAALIRYAITRGLFEDDEDASAL
jgi:DNA-binding NarL/FixJ family response regulator